MDNERWRFEPDTALVQMLEVHYDSRDCSHDDQYKCARAMNAWLEQQGLLICPEGWLDGG